MLLQSAKKITIFGNGQGILEFSQGKAGIQLTPTGAINFFGNHINALAQNPINFQGKINYHEGTGPQVNLQTPPTPLSITAIPELSPE